MANTNTTQHPNARFERFNQAANLHRETVGSLQNYGVDFREDVDTVATIAQHWGFIEAYLPGDRTLFVCSYTDADCDSVGVDIDVRDVDGEPVDVGVISLTDPEPVVLVAMIRGAIALVTAGQRLA